MFEDLAFDFKRKRQLANEKATTNEEAKRETDREISQRLEYLEQNKAEHAQVARELDDLSQKLDAVQSGPDPRVMCTKDYLNDRLDRMRERLQHMESTITAVNAEVTALLRSDREREREFDRRTRKLEETMGKGRESLDSGLQDSTNLVAKIALAESEEEEELAPTIPLGKTTRALLKSERTKRERRVGGGYEFAITGRAPPPPPTLSIHDTQVDKTSNPHIRMGSPTAAARRYREKRRSSSHKVRRSRSKDRRTRETSTAYWGKNF